MSGDLRSTFPRQSPFYNRFVCRPESARTPRSIWASSSGAPRADGFHALATVYQTLEMHELVTVTARPATETRMRITSMIPAYRPTSRNTAWKMVALALEYLNQTAEVEIHIEKRLPVQGGLGAGSGNAVAALVGLDAELGTPVSAACSPRKLEIAGQSRLRCAAFSDRRHGAGRRSRAGGLSACPTSSRPGAWSPCRRSASPRRRPFATGTRSAPRKV